MQQQRDGGGRDAAGSESADDFPVDVAAARMLPGAARLGQRGEKQVRSHCSHRRNPEYEYEQRRHQRTAADAGEADDRADRKTRKRIEPIHLFFSSEEGIVALPPNTSK